MEPTQATRGNEPHHERSIGIQTSSYPQDTDQLTTDELYQALSNQRRRQVIRALEDGPRELGPIARAIAAAENDIPVDEVDAQQRKRVYISLYQAHLDKLDNWDIIERDDHTLAPGPAHATALETIEAVAGEEEPSTLRDRIAGIIPGDWL